MSKSTKHFVGQLPIDKKYYIVDAYYSPKDGSIGSIATCRNCTRVITNIATVKDEDGNTYDVGLDCAETLQLCNNNEAMRFEEAKRRLRREYKFVRWVKKTQKEGNDVYVLLGDKVVWVISGKTLSIPNSRYKMPRWMYDQRYSGLGMVEITNEE